jgi:hypothetical protein
LHTRRDKALRVMPGSAAAARSMIEVVKVCPKSRMGQDNTANQHGCVQCVQ